MSLDISSWLGLVSVLAELAMAAALWVIAWRRLPREPEAIALPAPVPVMAFNPADALPQPIALPSEILDYCEQESEVFAQDSCKERARDYYADSGDWDRVLITLQRDDGELK